MLDWLRDRLAPRRGVAIWVIKQLDETTLHLCGAGMAEGTLRPSRRRRALAEGRFVGPICIGDHHDVLHSDLFARLPLRESLRLIDEQQAEYQGRRFRVSWVPERCWRFDGVLTSHPQRSDGQLRFVSHEDVEAIRAKTASREPDTTTDAPSRGWTLADKDDN